MSDPILLNLNCWILREGTQNVQGRVHLLVLVLLAFYPNFDETRKMTMIQMPANPSTQSTAAAPRRFPPANSGRASICSFITGNFFLLCRFHQPTLHYSFHFPQPRPRTFAHHHSTPKTPLLIAHLGRRSRRREPRHHSSSPAHQLFSLL
jgi:hypothetical protein